MKKVKPHKVDWAQIERFLASADKKLASAQKILAFDEEACLQQAYEAMLKASLGFMFSHGFRPRSQPGHNSVGYFTSSTDQFLALRYDLGEVERELSAQVERALRSGLRIDYVDYHMGTAVATPALRAVVERIANKYGLGISRYFGEAYHTMFDTPIAQKQSAFLTYVGGLVPGSLNLVVVHAARAKPEMNVLLDMNNPTQNTATGAPLMSRHRQAELDMLLAPQFARLREARGVTLLTYADVIARQGRSAMRRPQ